MGNVGYTPQAMPQPAAGIPFDDQVVTFKDLKSLREEMTVEQNNVNRHTLTCLYGLEKNQDRFAVACKVKKGEFKVPKNTDCFTIAPRPAKVLAITGPVVAKFVAQTAVGQKAYEDALIEYKGQGTGDFIHELAKNAAMAADDEALEAGKFIVVDMPVVERKAFWDEIQAMRADPKFLMSDRVKSKIAGEHKTAGGAIKKKSEGILKKNYAIWGFVESSPDPMDWEGHKDTFMAYRASYGFPVDEAWDGTVDWSLHRDK